MSLLPSRIPLWGYAAAFGASFLAARAVHGPGSPTPAAAAPTPAAPAAGSGTDTSSGAASGSLWATFGASGGSQTFPGPDAGSLPAPVPSGAGQAGDQGLPPLGIPGGYPGAVPTPGVVTGPPPSPAITPSPPAPAPVIGGGTTAIKPNPDAVGTNTSWTYWARFAAPTRLYRAPVGGTCPLVGAMNSPVGPSVLVTKVAECGSTWWYIVDPSYPAIAGYRIRYGDYNAKISP